MEAFLTQYENELKLAFRLGTVLIVTPLLFLYVYPRYFIGKDPLSFLQLIRTTILTFIVWLAVAIMVATIIYCIIPYIFFNI